MWFTCCVKDAVSGVTNNKSLINLFDAVNFAEENGYRHEIL